ncbi:hypothetical protein SDC9_210898 [bioreactor metagenome]|uniref:Uncharacterized protein n=1 Tax=bioreactor metagenome TaxID=1076179 RepID=A0A645JSW4_9ZZZZ
MTCVFHQLINRSRFYDFTTDNKSDSITDPLCIFDIMRCKEYRCTSSLHIHNKVADLPCALHIYACGWFIQEQNFRMMDDACCNGQLAAHPF